MKKTLSSIGLALAFTSAVHADYNPIALTPGSFTADVIVESNAPPSVDNFATVTIDGGTNANGNTFYEIGYNLGNPAISGSGLPAAGSTFNSISDGSRH